MGAVIAFNFSDMERMALTLYKAQMFKIKSPEQALGLMLIAQAEGLHPIHAFLRYHITEDGRPALKAETALALFIDRGGSCEWLTEADNREEQRARWTCRGVTKEIGFKITEAQVAGYVRDRTNWVKDPASQLRARTITRAIRMLDPAVFGGIRTIEELADIPPEPAPSWTPTQPATQSPALPAPEAPKPSQPVPEPAQNGAPDIGIPGLFGPDDSPIVLDYLLTLGWIKSGQDFTNLNPGHEARIRRGLSAFLEAARKNWATKPPAIGVS